MAKELAALHIEPAKNGGHVVRHEFKRTMVHKRGGMNAGMGYEMPQSEEHVFGPSEGGKMMAHVAKHLGVKGEERADEYGQD